MPSPRAVIIPFGVPEDGKGLGLGLAALVHSFAQIDGESVALAQLLARRTGKGAAAPAADEDDDIPLFRTTFGDAKPSAPALPEREDEDDEEDASTFDLLTGKRREKDPRAPAAAVSSDDVDDEDEAGEPRPVEAFVPPRAWKDLTGAGNAPSGVSFVLTGSFEPPTDGRGLIQLLAFEAKDGTTRARVEAHVDGETAGRALLEAFDELWKQLGGELGTVRDIGDLSWDALESVLRAERCALHDPLRGGPHDRLAAMVHLGRAIGDAPDARFPASRLAALALDAASLAPSDPKLADAALRALVRATQDAPLNAELLEAVAALNMRAGDTAEAERRALEALELEPSRARLYALLSEARRSRSDLPGALDAIEQGLMNDALDPLLNTERGIVLAERGSLLEAERAWRMVLEAHPLYLPAFTNLASLVMERRDAEAATRLVDDILTITTRHPVHPELLRRAIQLLLAAEPEGVPRAARVATLAQALVERAPSDAWGNLVLARSLAKTGDKLSALRRLEQVERVAPTSPLAAEARRGRLALEEPPAAREIEGVLRAAGTAADADLETIASRARRLALAHEAWDAWFAVGLVERRLERWRAARDAFQEALRIAPGATPVHLEVVSVHVALGEADAALRHARLACELDGETARSLAVLATALLSGGHREEASAAIEKALRFDASDEANRALKERIAAGPPRVSTLARLRDVFARFRRS